MTSPLQFIDDDGRTPRRVRESDPLPVTAAALQAQLTQIEAVLEIIRADAASGFANLNAKDYATQQTLELVRATVALLEAKTHDQTGDPFYLTNHSVGAPTAIVPAGGRLLGVAAYHTAAAVVRTFTVDGEDPIDVHPNMPFFWNPLGNYGAGTQIVFDAGLSYIVEGVTEP